MKDGMRRLSLYLVLLAVTLAAAAQEVTVNVMPIQRILPPQVMLYINNPGNYFNVQLINNSQVTQNVYIAMTVEQIHPSSGLYVMVPAKRQPQMPFTLAPGQVRQLTMVELKNMFNHVVKSEVQSTSGLFDSYYDGTFGLFPEGLYEASLTAYKWDPALANPVPVSNPEYASCTDCFDLFIAHLVFLSFKSLINSHSNICTLLIYCNNNTAGIAVKTILSSVVTNLSYCITYSLLNIYVCACRYLTHNKYQTCSYCCLAGYTAVWILTKHLVKDGI